MRRKNMAKRRATSKRKRRTTSRKNLEQLVMQSLTDEKFIKSLEKDPAATLKKHGYPHDDRIVKEILGIDFKAFRRAFPGRPSKYWC
jgi:hypothetical protein